MHKVVRTAIHAPTHGYTFIHHMVYAKVFPNIQSLHMVCLPPQLIIYGISGFQSQYVILAYDARAVVGAWCGARTALHGPIHGYASLLEPSSKVFLTSSQSLLMVQFLPQLTIIYSLHHTQSLWVILGYVRAHSMGA